MNIVVIGPSYPFKGGIAQYTTELYRHLSARHRTLLIAFSRQYPDWLYPGRGDRDLGNTALQEKDCLPLIDSLNPLSWRSAVRTAVDFEPDLVVLPWWVMFWAPQFIYISRGIKSRCPNARIIFLCHNVIAHEPGRLSYLLTRLTLRRGDGFLVHSSGDQADLERMLERPRVVQAEHPAYEVSAQDWCSREEARSRLGIEGDTLLFFGFVRPYKGVDILLEAMALVLRERPCQLLVAGEVWGDQQVWEERVQSLGLAAHVHFSGNYIPQAEVANYFRACDLVVLPYHSATGSGVVKLAYSYHRAVLVSRVGSLPEAVIDGRTGYVVEPGRADLLAQAILSHLAGAGRSDMEREISSHVDQFNWSVVVDALESLASATG